MALWSHFYNHQLLLLAFLHVEKIEFNSQQNEIFKNIFASGLTLARVNESRFLDWFFWFWVKMDLSDIYLERIACAIGTFWKTRRVIVLALIPPTSWIIIVQRGAHQLSQKQKRDSRKCCREWRGVLFVLFCLGGGIVLLFWILGNSCVSWWKWDPFSIIDNSVEAISCHLHFYAF